jgi:hypothetical protein
MGRRALVPPKTITCPDCGFRLTIEQDKTGSRLKYDVNAGRNRCKRPHLDDPTLCLVAQRNDRKRTEIDTEIHGKVRVTCRCDTPERYQLSTR